MYSTTIKGHVIYCETKAELFELMDIATDTAKTAPKTAPKAPKAAPKAPKAAPKTAKTAPKSKRYSYALSRTQKDYAARAAKSLGCTEYVAYIDYGQADGLKDGRAGWLWLAPGAAPDNGRPRARFDKPATVRNWRYSRRRGQYYRAL